MAAPANPYAEYLLFVFTIVVPVRHNIIFFALLQIWLAYQAVSYPPFHKICLDLECVRKPYEYQTFIPVTSSNYLTSSYIHVQIPTVRQSHRNTLISSLYL